MQNRELAKRLIDEVVDQHFNEYSGLYNSKERKQLAKDLYCKFLADLITLEDIREELKHENTNS